MSALTSVSRGMWNTCMSVWCVYFKLSATIALAKLAARAATYPPTRIPSFSMEIQ
jgi:hypothetical protein